MKYYLYVSDAKVDMLFAQIPPPIAQGISAELEVDFQIASVKLSAAAQQETRYSKLKVVEKYIRTHERVGSVRQPGPYLTGSLRLVFTVVGSTAVFCGKDGDVMVGLTGAARHLTANSGSPAVVGVDSISHLVLPDVARSMAIMSGETESDSPTSDIDPASALAFIIGRTQKAHSVRVEFLARTMHREDVTRKQWGGAYRNDAVGIARVLLGSPLYVALQD